MGALKYPPRLATFVPAKLGQVDAASIGAFQKPGQMDQQGYLISTVAAREAVDARHSGLDPDPEAGVPVAATLVPPGRQRATARHPPVAASRRALTQVLEPPLDCAGIHRMNPAAVTWALPSGIEVRHGLPEKPSRVAGV